ncbi:unnamed protein product [Adineta steineri]|uniref:Uncharacterized protein n=1 Tax=Adineta steineri TaxID=433720 RepID=A0A815AGT7_9BILA|nr:unnamed protein product [Adineta steineri]CAF1542943.1 unnamed protein product [Adineta steineri]
MRWYEQKEEGEILVGGNGKGNQLNCPMGLSFDDEGTFYVADYYNHRIEKFEIINIEFVVINDEQQPTQLFIIMIQGG